MSSAGGTKRLLIVKLSSLGDVVHALPTLCALRRSFPSARICWLVGPKGWEVVAGHPCLDCAYVVGVRGSDSEKARFVPSFPKAVWALRRERFDVALDLQGLLKSAIPCWLSGARLRIGSERAREGSKLFYNLRVAPSKAESHAVERCLELARPLGAQEEPLEFRLRVSGESRTWADKFLAVRQPGDEEGNLVALSPGSSKPEKCWPVQGFAKLAQALSKGGAKLVVVGNAREKPLEDELAQACQVELIRAVGETTVAQLVGLLERCVLFVGNDSGPLHIAAALGIPCLAFYGPTNPRLTGPYGEQHVVLTPPGGAQDLSLISLSQAQAACIELFQRARQKVRA
jgi:lipopolysaccharide heptosyltransferase I